MMWTSKFHSIYLVLGFDKVGMDYNMSTFLSNGSL